MNVTELLCRNKLPVKIEIDPTDFSSYAHRDQILSELGYSSYSAYLASPLWESIRAAVFKRSGRRCYCCSRVGHQIHHRSYTYSQLSGESTDTMAPIYRKCHEKVEFDGDRKVTLEEANVRFEELRSRRKGWCRRCKKNAAKKKQHICHYCKADLGIRWKGWVEPPSGLSKNMVYTKPFSLG